MKNFQEKNKWRKIMQSKPALIFLFIIALLFLWSIVNLFGKMQETITNKKIAEEKIITLQNDKEKLSLDIKNLQTEKGIEENIREKFGLAKEGEGMIVVVEDKKQEENDQNNKKRGFIDFLKNLFK